MSVFATVKIDEQSFRQAEAFLTRVPFEMRTGIIPKALGAAANPVVTYARELAPDSVRSGSRQLWSKKMQAARSATKQHKDTIGKSTVRQYGQGKAAIYIGPLYPAGNLINVIGHPHKQMLWGRATGSVLPPTDYLNKAAQLTAAAQQSAFVAKVQSETDKILASGATP